ncbi:MAG: ferredoxin [Candidatus Micrarchaeota archaeon]|nr:ferredoxin [Candidatus Micrarchaeota archaeon]
MGWKLDREKCNVCGACVGVCPRLALELNTALIHSKTLCNLCGLCEKVCPVGAIKVQK